MFICRGSIDVLDRMSKAADAICDGNLVEKQVSSQNNWNLLPTQVCVCVCVCVCACVRACICFSYVAVVMRMGKRKGQGY